MIPQKELADMRLTADNFRKTDMNDASMYIDKLFAHIDEQASQIATLKAALIGRDLRLLESCNGECGKNNNQPEDCDQCEHDTANLIIEMRNNADLLLSIAEAFQPGDAELMKWALDETEDTGSPIRKMLHRLQAAAERLEGQ